MTTARSETVVAEEEGIYHCISRCVRRAFLYGDDPYSGKNYDHRKGWIRDRLIQLVQIFTIELLQFALMDNHEHSMLRTLPELLANLSDEEVARRWCMLYPKAAFRGDLECELAKRYISNLASDKERIKILRERLGSVSWFMKSLNEYIARKANKEDGCKGRFWEGRFKCVRLADEPAVLSCAVYIDLNPIRAGRAKTPETSEYTSAYERIQAMKEDSSKEPELWFAPIGSTEARNGFLNMTLSEYLSVLDATGRELQHGKHGRIPPSLEPILVRLGIKPAGWIKATREFGREFSRIAGTKNSLKNVARAKNRAWFKGIRFARAVFA